MFKKMTDIRKNEDGFTMAEMLMWIIVIGILVSTLTPSITKMGHENNTMAVRSSMASVDYAISEYRISNDGLSPANLEDIGYNDDNSEVKVEAIIGDNSVCLTGWNESGGDYTEESPLILLNGEKVKSCNP